jgi:hypothetical protein
MKWVDITDVLTKKGQKEIPIGKYLRFEKVDLKVMRKYKGKIWAKRVFLYEPDEVHITKK